MPVKRIYSNYSEREFDLVCAKAEAVGLSASAYQKFQTLVSEQRIPGQIPLPALLAKVKAAMFGYPKQKKFIAASTIASEWVTLSRGEKSCVVAYVKRIVDTYPDDFGRTGKLENRCIQYVRK